MSCFGDRFIEEAAIGAASAGTRHSDGVVPATNNFFYLALGRPSLGDRNTTLCVRRRAEIGT